MKTRLADYQENIFSQFGDDGIIAEILRRIGISNGTCVEFGAWDGVLFANTAALWTDGWRGVLIEPEPERFEILKQTTSQYDCVCINSFVTATGDRSLERLLKDNGVSSKEVSVLSVDIDGNEYKIFENLEGLHPPIIVIEYNQTIPPHLSVVSEGDAFMGASAKALCELAKRKGYSLVALSKTNCFFVADELASFFSDVETSLENLFDYSNLSYLITNYQGDYCLSNEPAFGIGLPLEESVVRDGDLFFSIPSASRVKWNRTKDAVKRHLKQVLGKDTIARIRYTTRYIQWELKGRPNPPHMHYKRRLLLHYAQKHNIECFIETGTAGGSTVRALAPSFKKLYTIELDPTQYHQARARGSEHKHITFILGDSGVELKKILSEIKQPALLWLDAHYSGGNTAHGETETPIIKEISASLNDTGEHVILIDDAHEFVGTGGYPTIEELEKLVSSAAFPYTMNIVNNVIIIEPIQ